MPLNDLLQPARRDAKGRFLNPVPTAMPGGPSMLRLLPEVIFGGRARMPHGVQAPAPTNTAVYAQAPACGLRVSWFGHSSSLVEIDGVRLLIDPVWDERASPVRWAGPKRFWPPTCALADLPVPDAVLISHDHYDHLGEQTVRTLAALPAWRGVRWITGLGVGAELVRWGVPAAQVTELDWTGSVELRSADGALLRIDCWPARHFSGRSAFNRFGTLWSSWVLTGARHRVFYGADSGPWPGFVQIAARYDGFDLTMLEIGAYHPSWGMIHLGPDAAADAFLDMRAAVSARHADRLGLLMPIHWGLFDLALHPWQQPIERIAERAAADGIALWSPALGEPTEVTGPLFSSWWQQRAQVADQAPQPEG